MTKDFFVWLKPAAVCVCVFVYVCVGEKAEWLIL